MTLVGEVNAVGRILQEGRRVNNLGLGRKILVFKCRGKPVGFALETGVGGTDPEGVFHMAEGGEEDKDLGLSLGLAEGPDGLGHGVSEDVGSHVLREEIVASQLEKETGPGSLLGVEGQSGSPVESTFMDIGI